MGEQEVLFDLTPEENTGVREDTEIEYLLLAFDDNKKKEIILMMEKLIMLHMNYMIKLQICLGMNILSRLLHK